jgi:hypothetical protein
MIGPSPICLMCSRLNADATCLAFPRGIPERIYVFAIDHRKRYRGDQGIRFQLVEGKERMLDEWTKLARARQGRAK